MKIENNDCRLNKEDILKQFREVRNLTNKLCRPLEIEDFVIQSIEDVSPPKWHIAHVTWFFEQVVLQKYKNNYVPYDKQYYYLFNSYYNTFGERTNRDIRGTLSRPTVAEVFKYREEIDKRMLEFMDMLDDENSNEILSLIVLGLNHEQQHQELLLADTKFNFGSNPLLPKYRELNNIDNTSPRTKSDWVEIKGGLVDIGHNTKGFSYDNELPGHQVYLKDFQLMDRLVTCGEFLEFIEDNGYGKPNLWLDDGWAFINEHGIKAPEYWLKDSSGWKIFTLGGIRKLNLNEPVCHVSFFEVEAFARWAGARIPTEFEWETAARTHEGIQSENNFLDSGFLHPVATIDTNNGLKQIFGNVWEWTSSAYLPYPGYKQAKGALGEYNGKFMNGQRVCRGGSCITPKNHFRKTYRNFFQPDKRWVVLGFRLAKDQV